MRLSDVSARRDAILAIARRHGISSVRVFGSVAKNEQTAGSDLDLLVHVQPGHGLFDLIAFEDSVSRLLEVEVQAVSDRGLSLRIGPRILAEARPL